MNHELPIPPAVALYWQEERIKELEAAMEAITECEDLDTALVIARAALGKGSSHEPTV